jgi:purine-binding chemotaxis protein CheW
MGAIDNLEEAAIAPAASTAAAVIAAAAKPAPAAVHPREFLSFQLGAEEYGIDILKVQEIRGYEQPTRIVGASDFVKGVTNLRGNIVPVVDLRLKFGLDHCVYDGSTVTIVLNVAKRVIGVVVDSVSDVIELKPEQIKPAPEFSGSTAADHIIGMGTLEQGDRERMLILVDIEKLMTGADMGLCTQAL